MKKRIIALLLSISVLCSSIFCVKRAGAAPAVGIGIGVFSLAWQIIGVMTGRYDDALDGIRNDMDKFDEYFTTNDSSIFAETESQFQSDWRMGWEIICDTVQGWFDSGEVTSDGDNLKLTYEQYLDLYNQTISVMAAPSVDLKCGYMYQLFSVDLANPIKVLNLPTIELFYEHGGEAYAPIYFNDSKIVFVGAYYLNSPDWRGFYTVSDENFNIFNPTGCNSSGPCLDAYAHHYPSFNVYHDDYPAFWGFEYVIPNCWVYENGALTMVPSDSVDVSGMTSGYITTTGEYGAFLKSISDASVSSKVDPGSLNDLSGVLPTEKNPSLTFPLSPDLDGSLADQVIVGDVADAEDKPLADYIVEDAQIPDTTSSELLKKFPFCIPYDFVRFLGVFAADPIPPVFHIPISTHPDNLSQWADNETLGQFVSPDDPMFEIDKEIVIDFAHIPLVQPICYTVFIVGFVFLLLHVTTKFIQH